MLIFRKGNNTSMNQLHKESIEIRRRRRKKEHRNKKSYLIDKK
jgi:hypothetical protein